MSTIHVKNLDYHYPNGKQVLHNISFSLEDGKCLAILGPSGAGKSTLLRLLAGLQTSDCGTIQFDGHSYEESSKQKHPAMIFQKTLLYPHTLVKDTITYGLRKLGYSKEEITTSLQQIAKDVHIEHLLHRYPASLSGGEKKRVDIARALIRKPDVLLLDEPFTALDANLKEEMRELILSLQKKYKMTMIMVTHDQEQAVCFGDYIALIKDGRFLCYDTPSHLFDSPPDVFTASFLGTPSMNLIHRKVMHTNTTSYIQIGKQCFYNDVLQDQNFVIVGIRPEKIDVSNDGLHGIVLQSKRLGTYYVTTCLIQDIELVFTGFKQYKEGEAVSIGFKEEDLCYFDTNSNKRIEGY